MRDEIYSVDWDTLYGMRIGEVKVEKPKEEIEDKIEVDHPRHYNQGEFEVIDVIEDWGLGFSLGNAIKYIARADHKGSRAKDLEKAIWYIQRELGKETNDDK